MLETLLGLDRSKASRPLTVDGGATPPGRGCAPAMSTVRRTTRGSVRVTVRELFGGEEDMEEKAVHCGVEWNDIMCYPRDVSNHDDSMTNRTLANVLNTRPSPFPFIRLHFNITSPSPSFPRPVSCRR